MQVEIPWPGIEPKSPAEEAQSLNHGIIKEVHVAVLYLTA